MTMGMNGDMNAEQRLEALTTMLADLSDMVHDVKRKVDSLDANVSLCLNYCRDISRRMIADSALKKTVDADVSDTMPAPRPEAVTQPDIPKPRESS